jgi:hypothetical protein
MFAQIEMPDLLGSGIFCCVKRLELGLVVVVIVAVKVCDCRFISTAKSFAIVVAIAWRDMRMTKLTAVVDVGLAMIVKVLARAFDTIVKALALNFAKLVWRPVPIIVILTVAGERSRGQTDGSRFTGYEQR